MRALSLEMPGCLCLAGKDRPQAPLDQRKWPCHSWVLIPEQCSAASFPNHPLTFIPSRDSPQLAARNTV